MATINQIRGMLLEEVLLALLSAAGYTVVHSADGDPTLHDGHSGLEVRGRGDLHQIDAVADAPFRMPFVNQQRLLLEAKCRTSTARVGIDVVRNAVGVWKDVSEWWVPTQGGGYRRRYHYTYAIASSNGFSENAQRYAYAHDVFLIPLQELPALADVIQLITALDGERLGASADGDVRFDMQLERASIREQLTLRAPVEAEGDPDNGGTGWRTELLAAARRVGQALVAVAHGGFALILIPTGPNVVESLEAVTAVRILWDQRAWYVVRQDGARLFEFALPDKMFEMYAEDGVLQADRALDLKEERMSVLVATRVRDGRVEQLRFELDAGWIAGLRGQHEDGGAA